MVRVESVSVAIVAMLGEHLYFSRTFGYQNEGHQLYVGLLVGVDHDLEAYRTPVFTSDDLQLYLSEQWEEAQCWRGSATDDSIDRMAADSRSLL